MHSVPYFLGVLGWLCFGVWLMLLWLRLVWRWLVPARVAASEEGGSDA